MAILVCIDPGHVKNYNRGAYANYYEGNKMYDLAIMLKEEIEKYNNISAFITRNNVSDNPTLEYRAKLALSKGARCFLSLHSDATGTESVNRVSCFRSLTMPNAEYLGKKLMDAVVATIGQDIPISNNTGVFTRDNGYGRDYYGVLRNCVGGSVKEAFILEHGFHTNYKNSLWLYSNDNLRKLAIAEAKVLANYYGCNIKTTNTNTPTSSTPVNNSTVVNTTTSNSKPTTLTSAASYTKYTVAAGDSWWNVASKKLGSGLKMNELAEFNNRSILSPLKTGEVIKIPSSNKIRNTIYTVKSGDSWWRIAKEQLGSELRFKELAEYNGMSTDTALRIGMTIKIPMN